MLLPSSLDCAPRKHPRTASYKAATTMLSPPSSTCQSPSSNMYSTCRALQSLLASNLPTLSPIPKIIRAPPHLGSPIVLTSGPRAQPRKTKSHTVQNAKITKPPPRSNLKRRRSFSVHGDEDGKHPLPLPRDNQENTQNPRPSTPKRQRTCPPSLPLGLNRKDFDALNPPVLTTTTTPHTPEATTNPSSSSSSHHTPPNQEPETEKDNDDDESEWSATDDSALVSLILNKLRLRPSDWDDCARKLGKEKDSIGRRWKHLLGDGEVGLRRGSGKRTRGNVSRMEFGPLLHDDGDGDD